MEVPERRRFSRSGLLEAALLPIERFRRGILHSVSTLEMCWAGSG